MIGRIVGTLVRKTLPAVIVDAGGVGYELRLSLTTFESLPAEGQPVTLDVLTWFRNEALELYGFATPQEKEMFVTLTAVTGVGPKIALALLSALAPGDLVRAVLDERAAALERVPGIGRKTAQRLVLELKDKLKGWVAALPAAAAPLAPPAAAQRDDALAALENLGYRRAEAERAIDAAVAELGEAPLAALLRRALRAMGDRR